MNYRILRLAGISLFCAAFATVAAAADFMSAPATTTEAKNLNALVEQVYGNIPEPAHKADTALVSKVRAEGKLPVIVRLRDADLPYGFFADTSAARPEVIRGLQDAVVDDVFAHTARDEAALHVKRFSIIPGMALLADPATLEALLASPNVIDVVEDVAVPLALEDSVPLIGADGSGTFGGYTGDGWAVAILDTGVDKTHPFLTGKVVSEACYSNANGGGGGTSLCPGGATSSTAAGSGEDCTGSSSCFHGTHVAGIAAGKGETFSGVAKDADIIAIQVFTLYGTDLSSWSSDQIKGLERVYVLRNDYNIASVNMSLGGGRSYSYCNSESQKTIIDTLRTAGIATVIASANSGWTDSISAPACIETAVSVGSTTKADVVSSFSNSADFLSLLAPGGSGDGQSGTHILSSVPGTGYGRARGTSMATPHVAGAWAVLKQAKPDASVDEILDALKDTGVPVTDTRSGAGNRVKPRIDVAAAVAALPEYCEINDDCSDARPFCVNNACVECRNAGDCGDGAYCNGAEVCTSGVCADAADPCSGGAPYCLEGNDTCVECTSSSHCDDGYACENYACEEDCDLTIVYKQPVAAKLTRDKKVKLKITGGEGFDPTVPVTVGSFTIYKTKPIIRYRKEVLIKNELQVTVIVPAGTPAGTYNVHMTPCSGTIQVL